MRVTRKALEAQNTQLRAQLAVHDNVTRKALNEMVQRTGERNKELEKEITVLTGKIEYLNAELVLAKTPKELQAA